MAAPQLNTRFAPCPTTVRARCNKRRFKSLSAPPRLSNRNEKMARAGALHRCALGRAMGMYGKAAAGVSCS